LVTHPLNIHGYPFPPIGYTMVSPFAPPPSAPQVDFGVSSATSGLFYHTRLGGSQGRVCELHKLPQLILLIACGVCLDVSLTTTAQGFTSSLELGLALRSHCQVPHLGLCRYRSLALRQQIQLCRSRSMAFGTASTISGSRAMVPFVAASMLFENNLHVMTTS